jgi:hypothetical protein
MNTEPKRLRTGSDALAESVASLQQALPSDERMAALAASLARAGAPVEAPAPAPRSEVRLLRGSTLFGPGTLAVLAALLFGGGLITGALLLSAPDPPPGPLAAPPSPAPVVAAKPSNELPTAADTAAAAPPAPRVGGSAPTTSIPPGPSESADSADRSPKGERDTDTAVVPSATPSPSGRVALRDDGRALAPSTRPRPTPGDSASEGAPLAASTVVESEIELLKQARSALGADPLQAFALSERCRAQYPNGAFAQEREYIAISALVRLGRPDDARSRASVFRMHYPNSAYLPRLARMLGE